MITAILIIFQRNLCVAKNSKLLGFYALVFCLIPFCVLAVDTDTRLSEQSGTLTAQNIEIASLSVETQPVLAKPLPKRANFEQEVASHDARHVADWIVDSGNNHGMPFVIVDKVAAKVFVFHADGRLRQHLHAG